MVNEPSVFEPLKFFCNEQNEQNDGQRLAAIPNVAIVHVDKAMRPLSVVKFPFICFLLDSVKRSKQIN